MINLFMFVFVVPNIEQCSTFSHVHGVNFQSGVSPIMCMHMITMIT